MGWRCDSIVTRFNQFADGLFELISIKLIFQTLVFTMLLLYYILIIFTPVVSNMGLIKKMQVGPGKIFLKAEVCLTAKRLESIF